MNKCTRVKITRSQRMVSFEKQEEEIVTEFSQQPKQHTTEGTANQDSSQLAVPSQPIASLFKSEE